MWDPGGVPAVIVQRGVNLDQRWEASREPKAPGHLLRSCWRAPYGHCDLSLLLAVKRRDEPLSEEIECWTVPHVGVTEGALLARLTCPRWSDTTSVPMFVGWCSCP